MSTFNIPTISPLISITRDDVVNLLLASIAMEALGLAHIMNAEGEKIQYALGTLPGLTSPATLLEILQVNSSVQDTLAMSIQIDLLLESRLKQLTQISSFTEPTGVTGGVGTTEATGEAGGAGATGETE